MVSSVQEKSYQLWSENMSVWLEPGLLPYAEIISLNAAIHWLKTVKLNGIDKNQYLNRLSKKCSMGYLI